MRILLDVDGVLADFTGPVTAAVNLITGKSFTDDDITQWDIFAAFGVSPEVAAEATTLIKAPGFCLGLEEYPEAREGVAALREFADVHPVTTPFDSKYWIYERQKWLENFGFDKHSTVHTAAKHIVHGHVLIDDKTSTLVKWEEHTGGIGILFARPWNAKDGWSGYTAASWPDLVNICAKLSREPDR